MKITVIGTGYVGLIVALGFADFGNDVLCLDVNQEIIDSLKSGKSTIYEPGADDLLSRNLKNNRISFTSDKESAIKYGEIIFIAVGTPEQESGEADLSYVYQAAADIGDHIDSYKVIVNKSTVPVGIAKVIERIIKENVDKRGKDISFDMASNPEFLREGKAVIDFFNPDRIVIGTNSDKAKELLKKLYGVFDRSNKPIIITTTETAEMIKYASNAFLATKITFINEIANLCEKVGANVLEVASAMGKDGRISPKFLHPGPGYGGSCFPKDTKAIADIGRAHGAPLTIIENVIAANERQKQLCVQKVKDRLTDGGTLAVLGLSFKPDTDDIRESSSIYMVKELSGTDNFKLKLYDPQAMENCRKELKGKDLIWCRSAGEAIKDSDCIVIMTEWAEFRSLDLSEVEKEMRGKIIFDFRNIFSKDEMKKYGFEYFGIGV